jgi:hypothetical protein
MGKVIRAFRRRNVIWRICQECMQKHKPNRIKPWRANIQSIRMGETCQNCGRVRGSKKYRPKRIRPELREILEDVRS